MVSDPDELRAASLQAWEGAAAGWARRQGAMRQASAPVSQWMVQAIDPQPGHRVLELAAGLGETGFLAAELTAPGGRLICSDQAEGMLEGARARAAELDLDRVEFKVIDAEWIDLPLASLNGVLCRWGYMLMADPGAALRETRRVLSPGGRLALATWDRPASNPWAAVPGREFVAHGHQAPPVSGEPSMFALSDRESLEELLAEAGFTEVEVDAVDFHFDFQSFDDWWEAQLDIAPGRRDTLNGLPQTEAESVREAIECALADFTDQGGRCRLPARSLVAAASA